MSGRVDKSLRAAGFEPDVAVVGSGPAGMMAAAGAADAGAKVLVIERLPEPGRRLLATGGGHCNFTNTLATDEFLARFGRNGRFAAPALAVMDSGALREFFAGLGEKSVASDGFHVFPESMSARKIRDALFRHCRGLGVGFLFNTGVSAICLERGGVSGIVTERGRKPCRAAVLACGGTSRPDLGGGMTGLEMTGALGHVVVRPCPALVPLEIAEEWAGGLAGVTLAGVELRIGMPRFAGRREIGPVLFTHNGISGPPVLNLSAAVARLLEAGRPVPVVLNPRAGLCESQVEAEFDLWRERRGGKRVIAFIASFVPMSLAEALTVAWGIPGGQIVSRITREMKARICAGITGIPLTVVATEGYGRAMAMDGGIALKQVRPETLESRLVGGLYFAGEMLDITGPCGGWNLQWAFSSGRLAGLSAASGMESRR